MVDERIPAVRLGAGYPRAYEMLMTMQGNGYKVSFMPSIIQDRIQPETDHLLSLGIQIVDNVDELIPSNMFDVLLISRPIVFAKEYQLLTSKFPEAWLVYDAEALFYIREQKRREVLQIGSSSDELEEQKQIEMSLIEKADQVISVSERERELMLQNSTQKNISIYAYYPPKKSGGLPFEEREGVLLVGSFFAGPGCPNEDAALWFVKEVWPEVQKEIGCKLYIVGSEPTDSVKALGDNDNVVVTGYVEDIGYYYNHCRVNVVPTRFSAGVPLKVIEALTYDIPTIASPIVIKQMVQNVGELVGANSNNQWIYHIIRSYTEPDFWRTINDKDVNG